MSHYPELLFRLAKLARSFISEINWNKDNDCTPLISTDLHVYTIKRLFGRTLLFGSRSSLLSLAMLECKCHLFNAADNLLSH